MRTIDIRSLEDQPDLYQEIAHVLHEGGLICLPTGRHYGIAASLMSEDAVIRLVQSKRRSKRAPSLVFIPDRKTLDQVAGHIPQQAEALMERFWPGPLTILFELGGNPPRKVTKTIAPRRKDKLGVRITDDPIPARIVEAFGGPLLISSANISRKVGSNSVAQIRKNFARTVDLMIDAGDLPATPPSSIVDPEGNGQAIRRDGAVPAASIQEMLDRSSDQV